MCMGGKSSSTVPPSPDPPRFMPLPADESNRRQRMAANKSSTADQTTQLGSSGSLSNSNTGSM